MSGEETRGILTESDKAWLRGEVEYEHRQTAADRRKQIRDRVSAALEDFALLNEHWSPDEQRKMVENLDDPSRRGADVIEFVYRALNEIPHQPENIVDGEGVDRALAFRKALCDGIRAGKSHFGDAPNFVLIDSNVELFEVPSKEQLAREIDTEQWRHANEHIRGAIGSSGDEVIEKSEAAAQFHMALHLSIAEWLYSRRGRADSEIKRHEDMVGASGPSLQGPDDE